MWKAIQRKGQRDRNENGGTAHVFSSLFVIYYDDIDNTMISQIQFVTFSIRCLTNGGIPASADKGCCPAPHLDWLDGLIPQWTRYFLEICFRNVVKKYNIRFSSYYRLLPRPTPHLDWLDSLIPQTNISKRGVQQYFLDFEF